jgi:hypothetical protein
MALIDKFLRGPIQGENLTNESRNYPWHRPPQYPDFDSAFKYFVDEVIANERKLKSGMTLVMGGVPATTAVTTQLLNMVSTGRISPDVSLVLAGPAYKVFTRMLDLAGIDYLTGFESQEDTAMFYKKLQEEGTPPSKEAPLPKEVTDEAIKASEEVQLPKGGLMGAPSDEEEIVEMDIEAEPTNLIMDTQEEEDGTS